jgi:hypothetical protein
MKSRNSGSTTGLSNTLGTILVLSFLLSCSYFAGYVGGSLETRASINQQIKDAPKPEYRFGPDISGCNNIEAPLWDCIKNVMYRKDL